MKSLLALPLVALLAVGALQPRTLTVTGRVTDAVHGTPLAGVQISVVGTHHGDLTDRDGHYTLSLPAELRGKSVELIAQTIGYRAASRSVTLGSDTVHVDFALGASTVAEELKTQAQDADGRGRPVLPSDERHALPPDARRADVQRGAIAEMAQASIVARAAAPPPPAPGSYPAYRVRREAWNTESYDAITENEFMAVSAHPLSTFSIDVDRASYSNIRRFLMDGTLPPKDAVRIEEMINYFPYDVVEPRGAEPFAVITETMAAPWQPKHQLVRISLQGRRIDMSDLPPNNLVFLIDVSGSMQSPDKLPLLKQALRLLVDELRPQDRVALVVYAGSAGLVLESTDGTDKTAILDAIESLEAGGSTAGGAGIRLAYDVARRSHMRNGNNRVILATDGDFNVGVSSDAEMTRLIEEKREQGTFLTVLGFGTGNLKDSKMEAIADHGNGNYAYVDNLAEARKVLVTELGGTLVTIAKDVKLQVEFNPAHVRAYRLIGYENRMLAAEDFDDDRKDAGELGAGHTVTALYEVVPVGVENTVEVRVPGDLRYGREPDDAVQREAGASSLDAPAAGASSGVGDAGHATDGAEIAWVKLRYKQPNGTTSRLLERPVQVRRAAPSDDIRFAAAVAGFGLLLRDSEHRGSAGYGDVLSLARGAIGDDVNGYRSEFVRMVEVAQRLSGGLAVER